MSLYREAGSRGGRTVATLAAVLCLGLAVGLLVAWVVKPEPTVADRVSELQDDVRPALDAIELVPIHYESTNAVTRRAAGDQLAAARDDLLAVSDDLDALQPGAAARIEGSLAELDRLLQENGPAARVAVVVEDVEREVRQAARLD